MENPGHDPGQDQEWSGSFIDPSTGMKRYRFICKGECGDKKVSDHHSKKCCAECWPKYRRSQKNVSQQNKRGIDSAIKKKARSEHGHLGGLLLGANTAIAELADNPKQDTGTKVEEFYKEVGIPVLTSGPEYDSQISEKLGSILQLTGAAILRNFLGGRDCDTIFLHSKLALQKAMTQQAEGEAHQFCKAWEGSPKTFLLGELDDVDLKGLHSSVPALKQSLCNAMEKVKNICTHTIDEMGDLAPQYLISKANPKGGKTEKVKNICTDTIHEMGDLVPQYLISKANPKGGKTEKMNMSAHSFFQANIQALIVLNPEGTTNIMEHLPYMHVTQLNTEYTPPIDYFTKLDTKMEDLEGLSKAIRLRFQHPLNLVAEKNPPRLPVLLIKEEMDMGSSGSDSGSGKSSDNDDEKESKQPANKKHKEDGDQKMSSTSKRAGKKIKGVYPEEDRPLEFKQGDCLLFSGDFFHGLPANEIGRSDHYLLLSKNKYQFNGEDMEVTQGNLEELKATTDLFEKLTVFGEQILKGGPPAAEEEEYEDYEYV